MDITADVYPYTAGSSYLAALLPPWAHEGGEDQLKKRCKEPTSRRKMRKFIEARTDWETFIQKVGWTNILVTYSEGYEQFENMNLKDIAEDWNKTPYDALFDIVAEDGTKADMVLFMMNEEYVERVLSHPHVMVGIDGLDKGVGSPHPRAYGTFPRVLGRYVREKGLIRIEEAVRKMTSLPAQRLGINDRGMLREGMYADMVIFDPQKVIDNVTYACPRLKPAGIEHVMVNGVISVENGPLLKREEGLY